MPRIKHTVEQVITKFLEAEVALSKDSLSCTSAGFSASQSKPTIAGAMSKAASQSIRSSGSKKRIGTREHPAESGSGRPHSRQINSGRGC